MIKIVKYTSITLLIIYSIVATIVATFFGTLVWSNQYEYVQQPQQPQQPFDVPNIAAPATPMAPTARNSISPEKSIQVLNILNSLQGFSSENGRNEAVKNYPPIQIFFDPRCHFCHKLFSKLDGKVPVHWIPVAALQPSEAGQPIVAELLNGRDENNSTEILQKYFAKTKNETDVNPEIVGKYQQVIDDNYSALALMSRQLPVGMSAGVPLIIIPRANGQIETTVGYSDGDENKIVEKYGK